MGSDGNSAKHLIVLRREQACHRHHQGQNRAIHCPAPVRQDVANGSINREFTQHCRRMFKLMVEAEPVGHDDRPSFPLLEEAEPRQGFLEPAELASEGCPAGLSQGAGSVPLSDRLAQVGAMRSLEWSDCRT